MLNNFLIIYIFSATISLFGFSALMWLHRGTQGEFENTTVKITEMTKEEKLSYDELIGYCLHKPKFVAFSCFLPGINTAMALVFLSSIVLIILSLRVTTVKG